MNSGRLPAYEPLEQLVREGQAEAALLWDESLGLTRREQDLVKQAFTKGLEIGKKLAALKSIEGGSDELG